MIAEAAMGMFNHIQCDYPLPDLPDFIEPGHEFQSKDIHPNELELYIIGADGTFSIPGFTGEFEFYTTNISGVGPGVYTRSGEDAQSVTYKAVIVGGKVTTIERVAYERAPAIQFDAKIPRPTAEQLTQREQREAESLVGRTVYVTNGRNPYLGKVVYENQNQLCIEDPTGNLHLQFRWQRDRTFFDSEAAATDRREREDREWKARQDRYEAYSVQWRKSRGEPA
jgi:hypothetical protein